MTNDKRKYDKYRSIGGTNKTQKRPGYHYSLLCFVVVDLYFFLTKYSTDLTQTLGYLKVNKVITDDSLWITTFTVTGEII
jgi:hypothetical protein